MRRFLIAVALMIGFFIISGRFSGSTQRRDSDASFSLLGVAAAGTLTGFTLTLSDYVIEGILNKGNAEHLTGSILNMTITAGSS